VRELCGYMARVILDRIKPQDMGDTSIRISDELADELYDRKNRGESYEDVIWRLISNEHNSDSPSE
jgi:hypothetical protein